MKSLEEMTPQELRELADKKEEDKYKPVKQAELKHDLYYVKENMACDWLVTSERKDEIINDMFTLVLKGTEFECYTIDGIDNWYDIDGFDIDKPADWVEEHLENIRNIDE